MIRGLPTQVYRHFRRTKAAAAILALTLLGACSNLGDAARAPDENAGEPNLPALTLIPEKRPNPLGNLAPVEGIEPERLKYLSAGDIADLLGDPTFRRKDPPAEMWQYRSESCAMTLFFYDEQGNARVAHVETKSLSLQRIEARQCFAELIRANRKRTAALQ